MDEIINRDSFPWSKDNLTSLEADDHPDAFLPTRFEIARACRRIRTGWDRHTQQARAEAAVRGRLRFLAITHGGK
jgi:hypothetical protein